MASNPIFTNNPAIRIAGHVLGTWLFNQNLEDAVGSEDFVPSTGSALFKKFEKFSLVQNANISRYGLEFEEGKSYTVSPSYTIDGDFTLAFWYYSPQLVGFTRHATTRNLQHKIAPIIAKANSSTTSTATTVSDITFIVTEIGSSKTTNAIQMHMSTVGADILFTATSESYTPGLRHVLISYSESRGRIRIDIDGKSGIQHSGPTAILSANGSLRINDIVPGLLAHKTTQTGAYIYDVVFNSRASLDNEALKMFRYGWEYIALETLFDARFTYFGMSYAQPTTISTTHIFVEGGNVFAARSNGQIVQGARPIWDKEFNYPDEKRVALLTTSNVDALPTAPELPEDRNKRRFLTWTPSGINLRGTSVRI